MRDGTPLALGALGLLAAGVLVRRGSPARTEPVFPCSCAFYDGAAYKVLRLPAAAMSRLLRRGAAAETELGAGDAALVLARLQGSGGRFRAIGIGTVQGARRGGWQAAWRSHLAQDERPVRIGNQRYVGTPCTMMMDSEEPHHPPQLVWVVDVTHTRPDESVPRLTDAKPPDRRRFEGL